MYACLHWPEDRLRRFFISPDIADDTAFIVFTKQLLPTRGGSHAQQTGSEMQDTRSRRDDLELLDCCMKNLLTPSAPASDKTADAKGRRSRRPWALVVAVVMLALMVGAWRVVRSKVSEVRVVETAEFIQLSDATLKILQTLDAPVTVRFYGPSDITKLSARMQAVAIHASALLAEYERVADGKLLVTRRDTCADAAARSAAGADGIVPFNDANGEVHSLGIVIRRDKRTEVMPQLSADWQVALESDLSRAIVRVSAPLVASVPTFAPQTISPSPIDPAISEELLKIFPDLDSWTLDDAANHLRKVTLEKFTAVVTGTSNNVQAAQSNLAAAQKSGSAESQQKALAEFQKAQRQQEHTLKQVAADLQDRIAVLARLKRAQAEQVSSR